MAKWTKSNWDMVMSRAAETALTEIGIKITADARALAPVRTGRLRGSITWAVQGSWSNPSAPAGQGDRVSTPPDKWTCYVGTNVEYAAAMEYPGKKRNWAGAPYLRPAMDDNRKWANNRYKNALQEAVLKYGK